MIRINKKILFPELSYRLTGIFFKIHKKLGRFCKEQQYADEIELILKEKNIPYKREFEIDNFKRNRIDFLIDDKIILEIKAKRFISKEDYNQTQRYLQTSGKDLGMIINFRNSYLKPKRILNIKNYSDNSDR